MRSLVQGIAIPLLLAAPAAAQFSVSSSGGDLIPASGTGSGTGWDTGGADHDLAAHDAESPPGTATVAVVENVSSIDSVVIHGLTHTWSGDTQAVLWSPDGVGTNLFVRPGLLNNGGFGNSGDWTGTDVTIVGSGGGGNALEISGDMLSSPYTNGGDNGNGTVWPDGDENIFNTDLGLVSGPAGDWTLAIYDYAGGDSGSFTDFTLEGTSAVLGSNYCVGAVNSTGAGSTMSAQGSASLGDMDLTLSADNIPLAQFGLVYFGPKKVCIPFGHGNRCITATATSDVYRLFIQIEAGGSISSGVNFSGLQGANLSAVNGDAGSVNFQCWYRDPAAGAPFFNLSDALNIVFTP